MAYNYSVIVPYRDKYNLFLKAMGSIPDREDIQIIIVDNALKFLSLDMVPVKQLAKVEYFTSSPNKGAGCARNEGLRHVEGRYILFLDADDYFTSEAFSSFDKYLGMDYDIVFFRPTSLRLTDGSISDRHTYFVSVIENYLSTGDDRKLRYRWEVPWAKLFRSKFVLDGGFQFEEVRVSNDAWFSLMTGYHAEKIDACWEEVYVVTEGEEGQSLVKTVNRENIYIRYCVAIKINKFLKTIGQNGMRIRLLGFLNIALKSFGFKEFIRYCNVARKNHLCVF